MEFNIGDLVICKRRQGSNYDVVNKTGIIRGQDNRYIGVEFFKNVEGHEGEYMRLGIRSGHCWFFDKDFTGGCNYLEKILTNSK
jgi:hypothetical protein